VAQEFKILQFPNTTSGQKAKVAALQTWGKDGWVIASETISPGKFKGGNACVLAVICLPFAFCAGTSDGVINVTLTKGG
jgi:hypothetical protein